MKKLIASALVAALMFGMVVSPAHAAAPAANTAQVTEGNRRPDFGPGGRHPVTPQPNHRPQPGRPGAGHAPQRPNHRPPVQQPSHRPHLKPNDHRGSNSSKAFGVGMLVGTILGSVLSQR